MNRKRTTLRSKTFINAIIGVIFVCAFIYLFHDVFTRNYSQYKTQTVTEDNVQIILNTKGFIVRDEQYIEGNNEGTVVPLVEDGNRVASNDDVAMVCNSEDDAVYYSTLLEYKDTLERYDALSKQNKLNSIDIKKLNDAIDENYTKILSSVANGNFSQLDDAIIGFENKSATKQAITDGDINVSEKMNELKTKIAELESKNIDTTEVVAPLSGYYISTLDGYEKTFSYDEVMNLTPTEVEAAIKSTASGAKDKVGKIVGNYKWYIVVSIDDGYKKEFNERYNVYANIPKYGYKDVKLKIERVTSPINGKIAVTFSCSLMNETYANMRIEDFDLILEEYEGFKVPSSAIRTETDDQKKRVDVVYILRGTIMNVRKIEIVYDAGDYVLVSEETKTENGYYPIKRYDEVIVKGRNFSNGKSTG